MTTPKRHRTHIKPTHALIAVRNAAGVTLPSPGTLTAWCETCPEFRITLSHRGSNEKDVRANLNHLVLEHVEGTPAQINKTRPALSVLPRPRSPLDDVTDEIVRLAWRAQQPYRRLDQNEMRHVLAAVLPAYTADLMRTVTRETRKPVCCDVYDRLHAHGAPTPEQLATLAAGPHAICYWAEAAARLIEHHDH